MVEIPCHHEGLTANEISQIDKLLIGKRPILIDETEILPGRGLNILTNLQENIDTNHLYAGNCLVLTRLNVSFNNFSIMSQPSVILLLYTVMSLRSST